MQLSVHVRNEILRVAEIDEVIETSVAGFGSGSLS